MGIVIFLRKFFKKKLNLKGKKQPFEFDQLLNQGFEPAI
jgi:hypothetical protein